MSSDRELGSVGGELLILEMKRQESALSPEESGRREALVAQLFHALRRHPSGERRRDVRIPAELEVRFRMGDAMVTCNASEISYGGLGLRGQLWIAKDQEIVVENLRAGHRDYPMSVRAKVAWKITDPEGRPGAGLAFVEMDESGRRQVRAVFQHLFLVYLERLASSAEP
jgi:hypothetical protein